MINKTLTIILVLSFIITSCSEDYKSIDPASFNTEIADRSDIESAEKLILVYYNYPENEGKPHIDIATSQRDDKTVEVTLIHEGLHDDSQQATKIVMCATRENNKWKVLDIRESWKCYEGRGHTTWGTALCN